MCLFFLSHQNNEEAFKNHLYIHYQSGLRPRELRPLGIQHSTQCDETELLCKMNGKTKIVKIT